MVVVITSTGGVSKRVFTFDRPVDSGLADWAASYLNERSSGMGLGARMLHSRLDDPSLPATERAFLGELAPAFTELADTAEDTLYVDGAHRLLTEYRFQDVSQLNALMEMLERRVVAARACCSAALDSRGALRADRRREPRAGAAARCRWWPPTTGCRSAIWERCR